MKKITILVVFFAATLFFMDTAWSANAFDGSEKIQVSGNTIQIPIFSGFSKVDGPGLNSILGGSKAFSYGVLVDGVEHVISVSIPKDSTPEGFTAAKQLYQQAIEKDKDNFADSFEKSAEKASGVSMKLNQVNFITPDSNTFGIKLNVLSDNKIYNIIIDSAVLVDKSHFNISYWARTEKQDASLEKNIESRVAEWRQAIADANSK